MLDFLIDALLLFPAVLIALSVHEYAHGLAAYLLGDPTAKNQGRLSVNPLSHLDPIGTLCLLFLKFGWAKPVPVDPRYFKNPRKGMAITALCGPLANLILAFLGAFIYLAVLSLFEAILIDVAVSQLVFLLMKYFLTFLFYFHFINLTLALFNCLPLPPLDGSRFLYVFLPDRAYFKVMRYERYLQMGLILLMLIGFRFGFLTAAASWISDAMFSVFQFIPAFR